MSTYTEVDYASILRHAAESLTEEGRHNQASILKDAADAYDDANEYGTWAQKRIIELEAALELIARNALKGDA